MAEVIAFTPTRQVITFPTYEDAVRILKKEYHNRIIRDAQELCNRHDIQMLQRMFLVTLKMELHSYNTRTWMAIKDKMKISQILWPMLLTHGRNGTNRAFKRKQATPESSVDVSYWSDYYPGEDNVKDIAYVRLPPQAQKIVDLLVEKVYPNCQVGVPEFLLYKYIVELGDSGVMRTKQHPWSIFMYYRKRLRAEGFLNMVKPGGNI